MRILSEATGKSRVIRFTFEDGRFGFHTGGELMRRLPGQRRREDVPAWIADPDTAVQRSFARLLDSGMASFDGLDIRRWSAFAEQRNVVFEATFALCEDAGGVLVDIDTCVPYVMSPSCTAELLTALVTGAVRLERCGQHNRFIGCWTFRKLNTSVYLTPHVVSVPAAQMKAQAALGDIAVAVNIDDLLGAAR